MKEPEMEIIAGLIHQALSSAKDIPRLQKLEAQVKELCRSFPKLFSDEWLNDHPAPSCAACGSSEQTPHANPAAFPANPVAAVSIAWDTWIRLSCRGGAIFISRSQ